MALVTIEKSPSSSDSAVAFQDEQDAVDVTDSHVKSPRHKRRRSRSAHVKLHKLLNTIRFVTKLKPGESYFTIKGAAVILQQSDETAYARHVTKSHGGDDIQSHLQAMFSLLRQQDTIKVAVRLEGPHVRYLAVVSCFGLHHKVVCQEESVLLGIDLLEKPTIGLVLPLWAHTHIHLDGDGGFCIQSDNNIHTFKPVSVQAMWSALQTLNKVVKLANEYLYIPKGSSHTWVGFYESKLSKETFIIAEWNASGDRDNWYRSDKLYSDSGKEEDMHKRIRHELKNVMMTVDLEEVTCMFLRQSIEEKLGKDLSDYKSFIDTEMMEILGQMDAPSKILDYLYLGSEWNASNLDELQKTGVKHILNISREIDNFFPCVLYYMNVREWDVEHSDLMRHWDETYKYINKARKHGSKALVHCKMGISRSASTVIAYLMKEMKWSLNEAFEYTKSKRSIINPNPGFWKQLETYEGILKANMHRTTFDANAVIPPIKPVDDVDELPNVMASLLPDEIIGNEITVSGFIPSAENDIEVESVSAVSTTNDSLLEVIESSPRKHLQYFIKCKAKFKDLSFGCSEQTNVDGSSFDDEDISSNNKDNGRKDDDNITQSESEVGSSMVFVPIELPYMKNDVVDIQRNFFNYEFKRSKLEGNRSSLIAGEAFLPACRDDTFSKFKPDGSWIKPVTGCDDSEIKNLDPVPADVEYDDGLGMGKKENEISDIWMEETVSGEQQGEDIDGDKDPDCNFTSGSSQSCHSIDPYIRENIPWNPGTVKKQKQSIEIKYGAPLSALNKKTDSFEISNAQNLVNSAFVLAGKMKEADCGIHDSDNVDIYCCEAQRMDVEVSQQLELCDVVGESLEMEKEVDTYESTEPIHETRSPIECDDMRKSVYEQEEIDLPEGIVKKTRQEIEERSWQSIDSPRLQLQRSSSMRSPKSSKSKDRDNEKWETCSALSSPNHNYTETDLLSSSQSYEDQTKTSPAASSITSETDHLQDRNIKLVISSNPDAECQSSLAKVYKYLGEELTVKEGLVRKQTLDIESKAIEKIHQRPTKSESSPNIQEQIPSYSVSLQRLIEGKPISPSVELHVHSPTCMETADICANLNKDVIGNDRGKAEMMLSNGVIEQTQVTTNSI